MFINEASKTTGLTKKAIEYYMTHGLITPKILENGYNNFKENDVEQLRKISVYRKIGLSIDEIKMVLADQTSSVLSKISVKKELDIKREQSKKAILDQLSCGTSFEELKPQLDAIEQSKPITDKLLEAFPGYYGRFICLHFANFLNEPIVTPQQQSAYEEIIEFLDEIPTLNFPTELQSHIDETTQRINSEDILKMNEQMKKSIENPEQFLSENKEMLKQYFAIKQSDEYKKSPAFQIQEILKNFYRTSGYYDIFIPAMKKLSTAYAEYYRQMEAANQKLVLEYPEVVQLQNELEE
jgi:DNA-binding transcriptional MerR regulator